MDIKEETLLRSATVEELLDSRLCETCQLRLPKKAMCLDCDRAKINIINQSATYPGRCEYDYYVQLKAPFTHVVEGNICGQFANVYVGYEQLCLKHWHWKSNEEKLRHLKEYCCKLIDGRKQARDYYGLK